MKTRSYPHSLAIVVILAGSISAPQSLSAQVERSVRLFDIRSITEPGPGDYTQAPKPEVLRSLVPDHIGPISFVEDAEKDSRRGAEATWSVDVEALVELVQTFISEDSWSNSRNSLEVRSGRLLVVQTADVLKSIGELLTRLEARVSRLARAEVALVPVAALNAAAPGTLAPGASPWLAREAFDKAVASGGAASYVAGGVARLGARRVFRPESATFLLTDHEVNQTGVTPVINPMVTAVEDGSFAAITVLPSPHADWYLVGVELSHAGRRQPARTITLPFGDLDLPERSQARLRTSVIVQASKTVVLGSLRLPLVADDSWARTAADYVALLRVEPSTQRTGARPPGPATQKARPAMIDLDALLVPLAKGVPRRYDDETTDFLLSSVAVVDSILAGAKTQPDFHAVRTESLLLVDAPEAALNELRTRLRHLFAAEAQLVQVDLWQGEIEANELSGAVAQQTLLPLETWKERFRAAAQRPGVMGALRARIVGLGGAKLSLAGVRARSFVGDIEYVSGGTGFSLREVGDPVVNSAGAGLMLTASAELVPGRPWAQLRVAGESARPPIFKRTSRVRINQTVDVATDGKKTELTPRGRWLTIELPDEDIDEWEHTVTVPLNQPILLNVLPGEGGKARALVAIVSAFGI